MTDLKPCGWGHPNPQLFTHAHGSYVQCTRPDCRIEKHGKTEDEARENWNRR